MAQRSSVVCDKCGRDIVNPKGYYSPNYALYQYSAKITLWGIGVERYQNGQRIELCPECYEKFIDCLEGGCTEDERKDEIES